MTMDAYASLSLVMTNLFFHNFCHATFNSGGDLPFKVKPQVSLSQGGCGAKNPYMENKPVHILIHLLLRCNPVAL